MLLTNMGIKLNFLYLKGKGFNISQEEKIRKPCLITIIARDGLMAMCNGN